jgi:hypothetical protein
MVCKSELDCYDTFGKDVPITPDWSAVEVKFSDMKQDGWGMPQITTGLDAKKSYGIEFSIPSPPFEAYDLWIDNVVLIK